MNVVIFLLLLKLYGQFWVNMWLKGWVNMWLKGYHLYIQFLHMVNLTRPCGYYLKQYD